MSDDLLEDLVVKHPTPGAQVAVLEGDRITTAVAGLASLRTGVEVTPDTLFQIGSVTKAYTATLVLQLADEGLLDVEDPVTAHLPNLRLAGAPLPSTITIADLLCHRSGLPGDHFPDHGRGDGCVERLVEDLASMPADAPPGSGFSYCNTGYVVLGRLVEVVRGAPWDEALREHVAARAGLAATVTLPEEAILRRAATGHFPDGTGGTVPSPRWMLPRSIGPAGLVCASAEDVLRFVARHLDGGLLSPALATAMRTPTVSLAGLASIADGWGLGWATFDWGDRPVFGHDGGTLGQQAFLRVSPDERVAVCVLANTANARGLALAVFHEVFESLGHQPPPPIQPSGQEVDPTPYLGVFERCNYRTVVSAPDGLLTASTAVGPTAAMPLPTMASPLHHVAGDGADAVFAARHPLVEEWVPVAFVGDDDGVVAGVHAQGRTSLRRVEGR